MLLCSAIDARRQFLVLRNRLLARASDTMLGGRRHIFVADELLNTRKCDVVAAIIEGQLLVNQGNDEAGIVDIVSSFQIEITWAKLAGGRQSGE